MPSDYGFAMVAHPHNPDCVYILPIESDEFRCTPEGCLRVYRTRNAGESWEPLTRGLPKKGAYETVLRDAMTADSLDPVGIYFGTRSGQVYGSADEGKTWTKILDGLPPVVCVKSAVVGQPRVTRAPRETKQTASGRRSSPRETERSGGNDRMPVTFLIPGPLRSFAGGKAASSLSSLRPPWLMPWKRCGSDVRQFATVW